MRLMRWQRPELSNWDPFSQLTTLKDEINRLFEFPQGEYARNTGFFGWAPAIDVYENKDNLVVKAELPGMIKEDIDISLHEGNLIISGERKCDSKNEDQGTSRTERFVGRFQRTLELPHAIDSSKVTATYKDGILTVTLPKTEESKPKQITVKAS